MNTIKTPRFHERIKKLKRVFLKKHKYFLTLLKPRLAKFIYIHASRPSITKLSHVLRVLNYNKFSVNFLKKPRNIKINDPNLFFENHYWLNKRLYHTNKNLISSTYVNFKKKQKRINKTSLQSFKHRIFKLLFKKNINNLYGNTSIPVMHINCLLQMPIKIYIKKTRLYSRSKKKNAIRFFKKNLNVPRFRRRKIHRYNIYSSLLNSTRRTNLVFTNYSPLFLFSKFKQKFHMDTKLSRYKIKLYKNFIYMGKTQRYKLFYSMFMLNFFESFLKKKI